MTRRALLITLVAACSGPQPLPLPLFPVDSGQVTPDAGAPDAGEAPVDAGGPEDAGPPGDSGTPDAGVTNDGGVSPDGGVADGGGLDAGSPFDAGLTYTGDIHPMFERAGCATFACHGGVVRGAGIFSYLPDERTGWLDLVNRMAPLDSGFLVAPGLPLQSRLVAHGRSSLVPMGTLTQAQQRLVEQWVSEGARYSPDALEAPRGGRFPSDAGAPLATCSLANARGTPGLPDTCLPRCSAATWQGIVDCRTETNPSACQGVVIAADMTPSVALGGGEQPLVIDCNICLNLQTRSCIDELCRMELIEWDRCRTFVQGSPCTAEVQRVNACLSLSSAAFTTCQRQRDGRCAAP
ncbi:MAG: hypothetical protein JNK82_02865 [Myxococcaceae bacterium]|nr:hypothetical protein [Myxococcaceae bacterium]